MVGSRSDLPDETPRLILPNLGRRFSGVTSTFLQTLKIQKDLIPLVVWGSAFVDGEAPLVRFSQLLSLTKDPLPDGAKRVYHARRNIEMLWGLVLRDLFRRPIMLVFTSTAQRHHTAYTRWLIKKMDAIITTSDRAGRYLQKPADFVVPHGIAIKEYPFVDDKITAWAELGLSGEKGIGIFGRIRPQKGVDLFVKAMIQTLPQFPEYTAVIVGKTTPKFEPFVKGLKKEIEKAGLSNRFAWLGEVDFDQLPKLYGAMSIVAAVPRVEGFGLTCLEAMSCGTPVIASRTGGFEMVVRDGVDGKLVECNDAEEISKAFRFLANDSLKLKEMASAARHRVEAKFSVEREARELVDAYNKLSKS